MATIDTVYVLGGGEYMMQVFNGVAAIIGSSSWDSMLRIAMLISAASFFVVYLRGHDPKEVLKFAAYILLVSSVLLGPKRSVQIIDRTDPTGVYLVDNVPLGLAAPAHMISSIGTSLTELYESIFHTPDSLTYSKTGMLFGADLVGNVSDIMSTDGDIAELMSLYTKNCVIGDILINHKYSFQELMNSRDPYTLIFQKPSPLRGVMVPVGNTQAVPAGFWTCEDLAKRVLMPAIGVDTSPGGQTWSYTVRRIFGSRPDANVLFSSMLGDSYNYYYSGSETASQLMRNSVVMNALKQGIGGYSAQSGDTASLVNLASTSSYNKMRLSWATSSSVATSFTPLLYTILFSLIVALFPIFILLMTVHVLTTRMLFNYIMSIIYLQSWAPMFAILNHATSFYLRGKTNGMDFNLANQASIQQIHSDIGLIAGWLTLSIPFIAMAIVKGLGPAVAQAGNYLGTAINSSAAASASQASDGTWAFNNMQTDNVTGNKWDTNSSFRDGQMTRQHASGATSTLTQSGQEVWDTASAMSRLPISIKGSQAMVSSLNQSARHAEATAASAQKMNQHAVNSSWGMLSQFQKQQGNSATLSAQSDGSEGVSHNKALDKIWGIANSYGKANGISAQAAYSELMDKTSRGTVTAGAKGELNSPFKGLIGGVGVYGDTNISGSTGSSHGIQTSNSENSDNRHDKNAQLQQQFREARDYFDRNSFSTGASANDNEANSNIQQFAAALNIADNYHEQYAINKSKSQEYSDMASWAENNSAQIDRVFDQQFASYVSQHAPDRAEQLLTNTSDPVMAKELDNLAQQFVNERILPNLEANYAKNQAGIEAMDNVTSSYQGLTESEIRSQHDANDELINELSQSAGIKPNINHAVKEKHAQFQRDIQLTQDYIDKGQHPIEQQYVKLQQEHQDKQQKQAEGLAQEKENQKLLPDPDNLKERVELKPTWPPTVEIKKEEK